MRSAVSVALSLGWVDSGIKPACANSASAERLSAWAIDFSTPGRRGLGQPTLDLTEVGVGHLSHRGQFADERTQKIAIFIADSSDSAVLPLLLCAVSSADYDSGTFARSHCRRQRHSEILLRGKQFGGEVA